MQPLWFVLKVLTVSNEMRLAEHRSDPSENHVELAGPALRGGRTGHILCWFGDAADGFS